VRKSFAVFFLTLSVALCWPQNRKAMTFIQEGNATADLQKSGLTAAHPSLPMETRLMVKNQVTGSEVEVTITGRIQASFNRIIDLSPDAAQAIDLQSGGPVTVYIADPPAPLVAAKPKSAPPPMVAERLHEQAPPVFEPAPEAEPPDFKPLPDQVAAVNEPIPEPITPLPPGQDSVTPQPPAQHTPPQIHYILTPVRNKPPQSHYAPPQAKTAQPQTQSVVPQKKSTGMVSVLPDPSSGKLYNLQTGAFLSILSADLVYRKLCSSGFEAAQEKSGDLYRVLVVGIPASRVYDAIQKLGVLGFREIWVRE